MTDAERIEDLQSSLAKTQSSLEEYKKLARLLQEENERLKRGLLGQKAERFSTNEAQLSLAMLQMAFGMDAAVAPEDPEAERVVAEHTRRKPKRKPLPEALPRVPIELLPLEVQREGLNAFDLVGTDVREVLERRAASTVVVQLIYKKFVRKDRDPGETTVVFSGWYNDEHLHSGIRYVTPSDRHARRDRPILANRHDVYTDAKRRTPRRWSRHTRNWTPVGAVYLNPIKHEVRTPPVATTPS